jgi:protein-tyrosine phosphatase
VDLEPFLPGTFNSRPVVSDRSGRALLIRSDAPTLLGRSGRAAVRAAGIRTAVDLREAVERADAPADLRGLGIDVHHVPVVGRHSDLDYALTLDEIYIDLLERRGTHLAAAVRVLSAPAALPALVFCSAGKDRTGIVVALALSAAGFASEPIVSDYARTEPAMHGRFRGVVEARAAAAGMTEQQVAVTLGAPAEAMRRVLAWLERAAGGAASYLRRNGLLEDELAGLRRGLLELTLPCQAP